MPEKKQDKKNLMVAVPKTTFRRLSLLKLEREGSSYTSIINAALEEYLDRNPLPESEKASA
jgi:hypothetical protein